MLTLSQLGKRTPLPTKGTPSHRPAALTVPGPACALAHSPGGLGSPLPHHPAALPRGVQSCLVFLFSLSRLDRCQKFELLFQRSGQAGHYMGMCGWGERTHGHSEMKGGRHWSPMPGE